MGPIMRIHFLLVRRVPPVMSPVLAEAFDLLGRRGFEITTGIAEEILQRSDLLRPEHDLYVLKSHTELSLSVAGILHAQGATLLNPYPACAAAQNKILVSRVLRANGIPAPDCWITGDFTLLAAIVRQRPLILKPYMGHRGQGISIVRSAAELLRLAEPGVPMLAQEHIDGSAEDLKVYVAGDEVFAVRKPFSSMSFTAPGRPCKVTPEIRDIALRCGRALGLGLYGLDLIENSQGAWVVDVNYFPGYKGVPDAGALVARYIEQYAAGESLLAAPYPLSQLNPIGATTVREWSAR